MPDSKQNLNLPASNVVPSNILTGGVSVPGTNHMKDRVGVGVDATLSMGYDRVNEKVVVNESIGGAQLITDSGFFPDVVNLLYYVRDSDYLVTDAHGKFLYVEDSRGRHKKIVTFKRGALPTDLAQVTILYYQVAPFPTKITAIITHYDPVSVYLDAAGNVDYDSNSASQTSHIQQN